MTKLGLGMHAIEIKTKFNLQNCRNHKLRRSLNHNEQGARTLEMNKVLGREQEVNTMKEEDKQIRK